MEVGPLARMLVAYASGNADVKALVDGALAALKRRTGGAVLHARPGRRPRARDGDRSSSWMDRWLGDLDANMKTGDLRIADTSQVGSVHLAGRGRGLGLPRGAPRRARPLGQDQGPRRSRTTRRSCRPPGTGPARRGRPARSVRGVPRGHAGRRTPSSRSSSCGPSTRSTRASRARSTSMTWRPAAASPSRWGER